MPVNIEPEIIINGHRLTDAQAMTIRVAIESFNGDLIKNGCGDDTHGMQLSKLYQLRINEIRNIIFQ